MTEPSNAVLAEQIRQLRKDFNDFKSNTREEIKELEQGVEKTRRLADDVNISMKYVKDAVQEMKDMMKGFITVVNDQNKKIDDFINSDKRRDSKRQFGVSVLQVVSGIVIALLGYWAAGKF